MKRYLLWCLGSIFLVLSCTQDPIIEDQQEPMTFDEIKAHVDQSLKSGKVYDWRTADDRTIWSAAMLSDSIFSIGYTIPGFSAENDMHQIDINQEAWVQSRRAIETKVLELERATRNTPSLTMTDLMPFGEINYFPQLMVQLTSQEAVRVLREMDEVRFVEPTGFSIEDLQPSKRSSSGCNGNPNYNINASDYTTTSPSTKIPWNFYTHNIPAAWSNSQGDNIRISIIDTGASDQQDNLGSNFASGQSTGRNILKYSTHYSGMWWWRTLDPPNDPCGHGTSMAGLAGAPRGTDGNAVGAAYKCNMMTVRAVEDVIISTSNERSGVRDALYLSGNRTDVKVISMSIGTPFYSSTVADGVFYAYNRGKLMFAAAGTSTELTNWYPVIFPANMSQCSAVTGIKEGSVLDQCSVCHDGPEVDFVIVMERLANSDRNSIGLARFSDQPKYIGGSSCATATTAGIAAMVWEENPSASRAQVFQALKEASHLYPNRDPNLGWGKIDAQDAVNNL